MPLRFAVLLVFGLVLAGGCSGAGGGTGRGEPEAVVRAAPDRTLAELAAQVEAAAPDASGAGRVALSDPAAQLQLTGPAMGGAYPELRQPSAVVDLVRGAVEVVSYGGAAVRDVSTFRYEAVIDLGLAVRATPEDRRAAVRSLADRLGATAFYADLWIDEAGRLRRVQVPVEKTPERPGGRDRSRPALVTVDFVAFGGA